MIDPASTGIQVSGLKFTFPGESFSIRVDSLAVLPGEAVAIIGPSGCGKSTMLRVLAGLLAPDAGNVRMGSHEVHDLPPHALREFRLRQVGLVFQDFALLEYLTVEENIMLPMRLGGFEGQTSLARAHELTEQLGISQYLTRLTRELSQGERQRVAVARALAHEPRFLFADEPTASLDAKRRDLVGELLLDYARGRNAPLILVTHDPVLQDRFDRVVNFQELAA